MGISHIFVVVDSYNRWSFMDFSTVDVFFVPPNKLQCIFLQIFRSVSFFGRSTRLALWMALKTLVPPYVVKDPRCAGVCSLSCDLPCLWQNFLVFNKHLSGVHAESKKRFILRLQVWENTCRWDHNHWDGSGLWDNVELRKSTSRWTWFLHASFTWIPNDINHFYGTKSKVDSLFSTPPKTKMSSENQWLVQTYFLLN